MFFYKISFLRTVAKLNTILSLVVSRNKRHLLWKRTCNTGNPYGTVCIMFLYITSLLLCSVKSIVDCGKELWPTGKITQSNEHGPEVHMSQREPLILRKIHKQSYYYTYVILYCDNIIICVYDLHYDCCRIYLWSLSYIYFSSLWIYTS